jgi:digeranylgeranylglycerophospholipid reductase
MLECDVFVIGCGPAGASLALYLAQKNIKVFVAEKKKNLDIPVRCAGFVPVNIAGLFDFKISGINNRTEFLDTYAAKNPSDKFHLISRTSAPGFILDRDTFINDIASRFTESGGDLFKGTKVTSIQQIPGGFTLDLSDLASKNHFAVKAKIIAGADGPLSQVGKLIGSSNKSFMPAILQNPAIILKNTDYNKVFLTPYISCGYGWLFPKADGVNLGIGAFLKQKTIRTKNKAEKKLLDSEHYSCYRDFSCIGKDRDSSRTGKDRDSINYNTGKDAANTFISIKDTLADFIRHLEFSGILAGEINPQQPVFNDKSTQSVTGLIPDSGIVENPGTKDGLILCGDAAGLCNPITGAGIYNAVYSAKLASEIIAKALSSNDLSILQETKEIYNSQFGNSINRALKKKLMQKNNWPRSTSNIDGNTHVTVDTNVWPEHMPNNINNWPEHVPIAKNRSDFDYKDSKNNIEFLDLIRQTWISFKDYWH